MAATPEALREARGAYVVAYIEVVRIFSRSHEILLGVVEGKDAPYYLPRIVAWLTSRTIEGQPRLVPAKGKSNVLAVREALEANPSIPDNSIFFIVDKDFGIGDCPARGDTYETAGYSVESFYVSKETIEKVIRYEILQGETSENIDKVVSRLLVAFDELATKFDDEVGDFHFWAKAQREKMARRVSLSPYDRRSYCSIAINNGCFEMSVKKFEPNDFDEKDHHPTTNEIEAVTIDGKIGLELIRGKQSALFIISFLEAATSYLRLSLNGSDSEAIRNIEVSLKTFVSKLSVHAKTPTEFFDFLDNFWALRLAA